MDYSIYMGRRSLRMYNFLLLFIYYYKFKFKYFNTTSKIKDYDEYTIYNKGNLYKIRHYDRDIFKVFYGTKEIAYCTTLIDCINIIPKL